jgi:hypothetical protein
VVTKTKLCLPPALELFSCLVYSSTLKMEATCSSETSTDFQWTIWCYIPEGRNHLCDWVSLPVKDSDFDHAQMGLDVHQAHMTLPFTSFRSNYSFIILSFDAIQSEQLPTSLHKPVINYHNHCSWNNVSKYEYAYYEDPLNRAADYSQIVNHSPTIPSRLRPACMTFDAIHGYSLSTAAALLR